MAFDFKKEYKEFYLPPERPEIVTVPRASYIAVRGSGDPNAPDGEYQRAIGVLYAVAYTLKMSYKTDPFSSAFLGRCFQGHIGVTRRLPTSHLVAGLKF